MTASQLRSDTVNIASTDSHSQAGVDYVVLLQTPTVLFRTAHQRSDTILTKTSHCEERSKLNRYIVVMLTAGAKTMYICKGKHRCANPYTFVII
jgi:hypothetical protein